MFGIRRLTGKAESGDRDHPRPGIRKVVDCIGGNGDTAGKSRQQQFDDDQKDVADDSGDTADHAAAHPEGRSHPGLTARNK